LLSVATVFRLSASKILPALCSTVVTRFNAPTADSDCPRTSTRPRAHRACTASTPPP
jgi:hypothetical protein